MNFINSDLGQRRAGEIVEKWCERSAYGQFKFFQL